MGRIISKIVADSNYKIEQFNQTEIDSVESLITTKTDKKGKKVYYVKCQIRDKDIKLTDEELVRQLYINKLISEYNYPKDKMKLEYSVSFGLEKKRADIVIFDKSETTSPYIIVELKKPKLKDGKEQLKSYCNATGALLLAYGQTVDRFLFITGKILIFLKIYRISQLMMKNCQTF